MFHELKYDLDRRGISIENYLLDIKKLKNKFLPTLPNKLLNQAKAALISRELL
jgi:hypothetical protein